jgi:NADP-dependent 3-hydroxy acid dehydrogenase YdfG
MIERGSGHIIMMSSMAAREVFRFGVIYCATKHALTAITSGLRLELQSKGLKVTEIRPGTVATEMRDHLSHPEVLAAMKARKFDPLTSEEVADAVIFAATTPPNACADMIEIRPRGTA